MRVGVGLYAGLRMLRILLSLGERRGRINLEFGDYQNEHDVLCDLLYLPLIITATHHY